jgi:glycine C-acetyltransferase
MPSIRASSYFQDELTGLERASLLRHERVLKSPQTSRIMVDGFARPLINLCSNNYLGLSSDPRVTEAARKAIEKYGYGLSSVRFICGTQDIHKELEHRISQFLGTEDTILYSSCFDANTGLFETLFNEQDAIISDELNHASIIDGIRLAKAKRFRYRNNDMADLERQLEAAADARFRIIATDGVFSMDGVIADLPSLCELASRYDALVMVDDSHATGFFGPNGRGTPEHFGVQGLVDLLTGTLGKALGGASGGYVSGRHTFIEWLRQRSRPYLFSNSLAPVIAATSIAVLDLLEQDDSLRKSLWKNTKYFRERLSNAGFTLAGDDTPIVPIMLGEAAVAVEMAERLLAEGINVIAFSYPVVPQGKARIRTQISASHTIDELDQAVDALIRVGRTMNLIA